MTAPRSLDWPSIRSDLWPLPIAKVRLGFPPVAVSAQALNVRVVVCPTLGKREDVIGGRGGRQLAPLSAMPAQRLLSEPALPQLDGLPATKAGATDHDAPTPCPTSVQRLALPRHTCPHL